MTQSAAALTASQFQGLGTRLKDDLNAQNPNRVGDAFRDAKIGEVLRQQISHARFREIPAADASSLATLQVIKLPDDAKAMRLHHAYARAGTVSGDLAIQTNSATPATGQIAITPSGDIAVLAADAIADLDFDYTPWPCDVRILDLPVATHVATIPVGLTARPRGVVLMCEVEALVGTVTGRKIVLAPAASAPATGQAKLNIARTTVTFAAADAVTSCRVKLIVVPEVIFDQNLRGPAFARDLTGPSGNLK